MSNDRSATRDAIETDDPHEELRLIREARKLRAQMVSAA
jgi:hypothetical protein